MSNPFEGDPFAGTATDVDDDPFSSPTRSAYPKLPELWGKLLLITPVKTEEVPKPAKFGGKPGETQTRMTADVVIFHEDGQVQEIDAMYLSQAGVVRGLEASMKTRKPLLGTLHFYPSKQSAEKFPGKFDDKGHCLVSKREQIESDPNMRSWIAAAQNDPEIKAPYNYAWGFEPPTPEEKATALKWWNSRPGPFSS